MRRRSAVLGFRFSVKVASVKRSTPATETAFSRARRTTFVGSMMPAWIRSTYCPRRVRGDGFPLAPRGEGRARVPGRQSKGRAKLRIAVASVFFVARWGKVGPIGPGRERYRSAGAGNCRAKVVSAEYFSFGANRVLNRHELLRTQDSSSAGCARHMIWPDTDQEHTYSKPRRLPCATVCFS